MLARLQSFSKDGWGRASTGPVALALCQQHWAGPWAPRETLGARALKHGQRLLPGGMLCTGWACASC